MSKPLGLYIHVPFCKQKCVYCDFYSLPRREDQMDAYAAPSIPPSHGTHIAVSSQRNMPLPKFVPSYTVL